MHFSNTFFALIAASGFATAAPNPNSNFIDLSSRQALDLNQTLADARTASADALQRGAGPGRRLNGLAACSEACKQCQRAATLVAVGEVGLCGTAALATEVATAGINTVLEVMGFFSCEAIVIGTLNNAETECLSRP